MRSFLTPLVRAMTGIAILLGITSIASAQPAVFEILPATSPARDRLTQTKTQVLFTSGDGQLAAFDLPTASWQARRSFPKGFAARAAVVLRDDRVLVLGEQDDRPRALLGDGTTDWRFVAAPPLELDGRSLALLDDGRVIAVGGYDDTKSRGSNKCFFFDPKSGRWSPAPNLPEPAWFGEIFRRKDGSLYYVAHLPTPQQPRVFQLDSSGRVWTKRARAASNQIVSGNTLLADDRLILIGGNGDTDGTSPPTRVLSASAAAFDELPPLPDMRTNLLALEIKEGTVLALGGIAGVKKAPPALLFLDMASPRWRVGPAFPVELMPQHAVRYGDRLFVFAIKGTPLARGDANLVVAAKLERLLPR